VGQSQLWLIMKLRSTKSKIPAAFWDCLRLRRAVPERRLPDNKNYAGCVRRQICVKNTKQENKREFQSLTAYYFHTDESSVTMLLEDLLQ